MVKRAGPHRAHTAHWGHAMVRTARSGEAGQLDAAPPRATPKTVSHNDTLYHISIHRSVTAGRLAWLAAGVVRTQEAAHGSGWPRARCASSGHRPRPHTAPPYPPTLPPGAETILHRKSPRSVRGACRVRARDVEVSSSTAHPIGEPTGAHPRVRAYGGGAAQRRLWGCGTGPENNCLFVGLFSFQ